MRKAFPAHVEVVRATGKIAEAIMDMADIPASLVNDRRKIPKDERVLHQQRSCILNGEAVVEQYKAYLKRKEEVASSRLQSGKAIKRTRGNPETEGGNRYNKRTSSTSSRGRRTANKCPLLAGADENEDPEIAHQSPEKIFL